MLPALPPQLPLFVWHEYPPGRTPRYIELNLRLARRLAPPYFAVHVVGNDSIGRWAGDGLPAEFWSLPYAAARADVARTLLLMRHGGLWIDADVLVARPLGAVRRLLEAHEFVSYAIRGQSCAEGAFSANFVAARPGSAFWRRAWDAERALLRQRCRVGGALRPRCDRLPWGSTGMGVWQAIGKKMASAGDLDLACFSGGESFAPDVPGARLSVFQVPATPLCPPGSVVRATAACCERDARDLVCRGRRNHTGRSEAFFDRLAYHLFESMWGAARYEAMPRIERVDADGALVASLLYAEARVAYPEAFEGVSVLV